MIGDESEGRMNYHLIEINSESIISNKWCVSEEYQFNVHLLHDNMHVMSTPASRARDIIDSFETHSVKRERRPKRTEAKRKFENIHGKYLEPALLKRYKSGWNDREIF